MDKRLLLGGGEGRDAAAEVVSLGDARDHVACYGTVTWYAGRPRWKGNVVAPMGCWGSIVLVW